jgi:hypothetical protein
VGKRGKIDSKPVCHNPSCFGEELMLIFGEEKSSKNTEEPFLSINFQDMSFLTMTKIAKSRGILPICIRVRIFLKLHRRYQNIKRHMLKLSGRCMHTVCT